MACSMAIFLTYSYPSFAETSAQHQRWMYYEKVVNDKIWTVKGGSRHEATWAESYKKEMEQAIGELIQLAEAGNPKAKKLIEKMLTAGVPRLVKHYCLRPATVADYKAWLDGFIARGGKIGNFYHSPLAGSPHLEKMWVAKKNFHLASQYGTKSLVVIVPKGKKFLGEELGHNVILTMDGFRQVGTAWIVSTFTDTGFE